MCNGGRGEGGLGEGGRGEGGQGEGGGGGGLGEGGGDGIGTVKVKGAQDGPSPSALLAVA